MRVTNLKKHDGDRAGRPTIRTRHMAIHLERFRGRERCGYKKDGHDEAWPSI